MSSWLNDNRRSTAGTTFLVLLLIAMVYSPVLSQGHPGMIVVLSGQVLEMEAQEPIPQFPLHIDQVRPFTTDNHGFFKVPVPYASGVVRVQLRHPRYEILSPPEGSKILSASLKPNSTVNLEIWVLGADASDELKNQLFEAREEIARLKKNNEITGRQVEHLNRTLLDSIRVFHHERKRFRTAVDSLENQLSEKVQREQQLTGQLSMLKEQIATLEASNRSLITRLASALEERYLRQKILHDEITQSLLNYESRLKDLRDQLKKVGFVFRSSQAGKYFAETIENYSESRNEINNTRETHSEAIQHYWEIPSLQEAYNRLVQLILRDIHDEEILPLNDSVLLSIQEASVGKRVKVKKTEKTANETVERLDVKIELLEDQMKQFLNHLKEY